MRRRLLLGLSFFALFPAGGVAVSAAGQRATCRFAGYEIVYASGRARVLQRPRFGDAVVCDARTGFAYDLVGTEGEESRPHRERPGRVSGTRKLALRRFAARGRWLMFQTGRDLGSFQHDIHLVAWKVPTGEVRSVYTSSSSLGPYLSRSYLLSGGTVVFSGGTAGGPGPGNTVSELVAYDRPFKGRTVLDRSDHSNIDPQPVDPGSLAVAGRTAYWRHSGAVRTAKIPH